MGRYMDAILIHLSGVNGRDAGDIDEAMSQFYSCGDFLFTFVPCLDDGRCTVDNALIRMPS